MLKLHTDGRETRTSVCNAKKNKKCDRKKLFQPEKWLALCACFMRPKEHKVGKNSHNEPKTVIWQYIKYPG